MTGRRSHRTGTRWRQHFCYVWPLWCGCSFSGCEWAYCHGTLLSEFSIPKCGGILGGNDQNRAEKQNVVLTWFRPVTWSSGHLGRRKLLKACLKAPALTGHVGHGQTSIWPTQEPPPSPLWQLTQTMVWVLSGRKLGPWSEFPFLYRFTVLLNPGGSNSPWSEFWSEFPHFMGMGVVPAPSVIGML